MATSEDVGRLLTDWIDRSGDRLSNALADRMGIAALLDFLYEEGFSSRDVYHATNVSQVKMNRWHVKTLGGKDIAPEFDDDELNRLSRLVGWCDSLRCVEVGTDDVATWFETPFQSERCPLKPFDLFKAGRMDLVAEYALDLNGLTVLNKFDPGWRERYASDWEVFRSPDGFLSIRKRGSGKIE